MQRRAIINFSRAACSYICVITSHPQTSCFTSRRERAVTVNFAQIPSGSLVYVPRVAVNLVACPPPAPGQREGQMKCISEVEGPGGGSRRAYNSWAACGGLAEQACLRSHCSLPARLWILWLSLPLLCLASGHCMQYSHTHSIHTDACMQTPTRVQHIVIEEGWVSFSHVCKIEIIRAIRPRATWPPLAIYSGK